MKHISIIASLAACAAISASPALAQLRVGPSTRTDAGPGGTISNEITQAASFADPLIGIGGYNDYRSGIQTWFTYTKDGGDSWQEVLIRPPVPNQSGVEGDPMACYDQRTGTLWAGGISFSGNGGLYSSRYDPLTDTFAPSTMIQAAGGTDKGWMAAGPDPTDADKTIVYAAYNFGVARSVDMGDTWAPPVSLGNGIGFLPRVAADGAIHVLYYDFATAHRIRSSFDGGVTWTPSVVVASRMDNWPIQSNPRIAGSFRTPSLQGFATHPTDPDRMYCVFPDTTDISGSQADVDTYFTKSADAGATWSVPVVINGDAPFVGDQWFPWIEVDEEGRLHVTYYDSRNTNQSDSSSVNVFDAYYAFSGDDGATWAETRLTEASFSSADDGFGSGFIGDYIGMSTGGSRALPLYMRTNPGSQADVYTNVILVDEAQEFCRGIRCPCGNVDPARGCGNNGIDGDPTTGAELSATGSASIAADDLVMTVEGVVANQFGVLVVGSESGSTTVGDGQLCLGGTLVRYPVFQVNGAGTASVGPGTIVSFASGTPIGAPNVGTTWYFQSFYRDPGGPCSTNFNFTNALSVTWEL